MYLKHKLNTQRINKFLANYGVCSRRKVDLMIQNKEILVNGSFAEIGMKINPNFDRVSINGQEVKNLNTQFQVILLNKPKNVITSCSDKYNRKTVIDLLPKKFKKGFFPIGRLDFLSRGALLITNSGEICYKLSHPKFEHKKIYEVKMIGEFKNNDLQNWRKGVNIDGKKTHPCEIEIIEKNSKFFALNITLFEGRNRQIRKIASSFGYKVIDLKRVNFANIPLGNLKEGEWKTLNISTFKNI